MKNNIQVIHQQEVLEKEFKVYGTPEKMLFLAKDVAEWIEHSNLSMMLKSVDDDEKVKISPKQSLGLLTSNNEYWFLTEDGLYEVLMQSRRPIAKQFKKKVKEILRNVRQYGAYMTEDTIEKALNNPDFLLQLATKLKEEQNARMIAEQKVMIQKPKVEAFETFLATENTFSITEVAKTLGIGRNILHKFLRDRRVLLKVPKNVPAQRYIDRGLFKVIFKKDDSGNIVLQTRVTASGVDFIRKALRPFLQVDIA